MKQEIQQAIEDLKYAKTSVSFWGQDKSLDLAIEALKKQMPMKPIDTDEGHKCPNCKGHIWHERQLMHCLSCGQKIYWG